MVELLRPTWLNSITFCVFVVVEEASGSPGPRLAVGIQEDASMQTGVCSLVTASGGNADGN